MDEREPTVWVPLLPTRWDEATQSRVPSMDLNPASKFGDIRSLVDPNEPRDAVTDELNRQVDMIEFDDYILCVGDAAFVGITIAFALNHHGVAHILRWDRDTKSYKPEVLVA